MIQQKTLKLITFAKLANIASASLFVVIALMLFYLTNAAGNIGILILFFLGFLIIPAGLLTSLVATISASLACSLFATEQTEIIGLHPRIWQSLAIAGAYLVGLYVSIEYPSYVGGDYFGMNLSSVRVLAPAICYSIITFVPGALAASKITSPIRTTTLIGLAFSSISFLILYCEYKIISPHIDEEPLTGFAMVSFSLLTTLALAVPLFNAMTLARLEHWVNTPGEILTFSRIMKGETR